MKFLVRVLAVASPMAGALQPGYTQTGSAKITGTVFNPAIERP